MINAIEGLAQRFGPGVERLQERDRPAPRRSSRGEGGNHVFVNNVRFWCMLAIVAMHSTNVLSASPHSPLLQAIVTPFKFGTIGFFLASGFLLGERVDRCEPLKYFGQRLQKVFLPWLVWFTMLLTCVLARNIHRGSQALPVSPSALPPLVKWAALYMFSTAFWFVPNLLLAIGILLVFRRHLVKLWFGMSLCATNLFYAVNIYGGWIPSTHTQALLGFVFYLWLGSFAARHFGSLKAFIAQVPIQVLFAFALLSGLCAFGEARALTALNMVDPLNTLRATNQIFSVAVVLLLLKVRRPTWPTVVDVRDHTFAIYLSHTLVLDLVVIAIKGGIHPGTVNALLSTALGRTSLWLTTFACTYATCAALSRVLAAQPYLHWAIGIGSRQRSAKHEPSQVFGRVDSSALDNALRQEPSLQHN